MISLFKSLSSIYKTVCFPAVIKIVKLQTLDVYTGMFGWLKFAFLIFYHTEQDGESNGIASFEMTFAIRDKIDRIRTVYRIFSQGYVVQNYSIEFQVSAIEDSFQER
jgi:hypothetical protein